MLGRRRLSWSDGVALISGLALLGYAAERARRIEIAYDEALTYLAYVLHPVRMMFTYNGGSANNHVLNSIAMKVTSALFGTSEFALRLPNLAGFAAFLVFSWLLLRRFAPPILALGGFLATAANPLLVEYFSVARGYGLALGFVIPGLYFLARSVEEDGNAGRREAIAFVLLALGVTASFTTLVVFFAAGLAALVVRWSEVEQTMSDPGRRQTARRELIRGLVSFGAVSVCLFAAVGLLLVRLQRKRQLYYGGHTGFWTDTVGSLVEGSLSSARYSAAARPAVLALAVVVFALVAAAAVFSGPEREGELAGRASRLMALVAVLSVGVSLSQHFVLGTLYLVNRTALFLIPLFGLAATLSVARFAAASPRRGGSFVEAGFGSVAAICVIHLISTANLRSINPVPIDGEMLNDLDRARANDCRAIIHLGVSWVFEPQVNYYRVTRGLNWLLPVHTRFSYSNVDYCFVAPADQPEAVRNGFVVVDRYRRTGNELLRLGEAGLRRFGTAVPAHPGA